MDADERAEFIKETLEDFRASGREALQQRYPELSGGAANDDAPLLPQGFVLAR